MIAKALESGWVDMVYEDDEARILKIRPEKGEPAKDSVDEAPETPEEKQVLDEDEKNDEGANANIANDDPDN